MAAFRLMMNVSKAQGTGEKLYALLVGFEAICWEERGVEVWEGAVVLWMWKGHAPLATSASLHPACARVQLAPGILCPSEGLLSVSFSSSQWCLLCISVSISPLTLTSCAPLPWDRFCETWRSLIPVQNGNKPLCQSPASAVIKH